jgi:signal transduction histidine kinase
LKAECERFSQCPVRLEVNTRDIPDALPQDVALCLFRIAQEGLCNARHAGAGRAEISLRRLDGGLELAVKDDGAVTIARMSLPGTFLPCRPRQLMSEVGRRTDSTRTCRHGRI